jgi:YVTN family beta-propeller protein
MRIILASLILLVLYTAAALAQNVYIANQGSNTVSVISDNPTVTVDVGVSPSALAVTPDGDFV